MSYVIERQSLTVLPPCLEAVVAVNCQPNAATVVDLTTIPTSPCVEVLDVNPISRFIRITADGGAVYFAIGANFALLNAINTTANFSGINATTGKVTVGGRECDVIPSGTYKDVYLMPNGTVQTQIPPGGASPVRYLAVLSASGNPVARIYQRST